MKDKNTIQGYWDELMAHPSSDHMPEKVKATFQEMFYGGAIAIIDLYRNIDKHPNKEVRDAMKIAIEKEAIDFNINKLKDRSPEDVAKILVRLLEKITEKYS